MIDVAESAQLGDLRERSLVLYKQRLCVHQPLTDQPLARARPQMALEEASRLGLAEARDGRHLRPRPAEAEVGAHRADQGGELRRKVLGAGPREAALEQGEELGDEVVELQVEARVATA